MIKYRKEKEFDELFLRKTQWQANIYQINDEESDIVCSLQPNKWNESELISNILISTKNSPLKTGMILYIYQRINSSYPLTFNFEIAFLSFAILRYYPSKNQ